MMIPLEAYFARNRHTPNVQRRIARMNPDGVEEGFAPRGFRPKRSLWEHKMLMNIVSVREFRQRWGDPALMWLAHCGRIVKLGGKRRAITGLDYVHPFR